MGTEAAGEVGGCVQIPLGDGFLLSSPGAG